MTVNMILLVKDGLHWNMPNYVSMNMENISVNFINLFHHANIISLFVGDNIETAPIPVILYSKSDQSHQVANPTLALILRLILIATILLVKTNDDVVFKPINLIKFCIIKLGKMLKFQ